MLSETHRLDKALGVSAQNRNESKPAEVVAEIP